MESFETKFNRDKGSYPDTRKYNTSRKIDNRLKKLREMIKSKKNKTPRCIKWKRELSDGQKNVVFQRSNAIGYFGFKISITSIRFYGSR